MAVGIRVRIRGILASALSYKDRKDEASGRSSGKPISRNSPRIGNIALHIAVC